ncbi:MAG: hypothetical protein Kow0042_31070 [Calditrichia bacterium]
MKVNELSKINFVANVHKAKKVRMVNKEQNADKVELSREAKALSKKEKTLSPEKIAEIQKKIDEKYYDQEEVLKVVAERILNSPNFLSNIQGKNVDKNI